MTDSVAGTARQPSYDKARAWLIERIAAETPNVLKPHHVEAWIDWAGPDWIRRAAEYAESELAGLRTQLEQAQREHQELIATSCKLAEMVRDQEAEILALSSLQEALRQLYVDWQIEARHMDPKIAANVEAALNPKGIESTAGTDDLRTKGIIGKVAFLDGPDSESSATTEHLHTCQCTPIHEAVCFNWPEHRPSYCKLGKLHD